MVVRPPPDPATYGGAGPGITFRSARVGGSVGDSNSEPGRQRKYEEHDGVPAFRGRCRWT